MTVQQLVEMSGLYLLALVLVVFFTRATARRVVGAVIGGGVAGAVAIGADVLGEKLGWWRMTMLGPRMLPFVYLGLVISVAPIFLVTWRVARRFGMRGLAVVVVVLTALGPPRDYAYMARFPEWGRYASGVLPILAIAALYAMLVPVGHSVMRRIAGPANADSLARRPWESA